MTRSILFVGLVAAAVAATPAMAAPVTLTAADLNQSFTILYNGTDDNVNDPDSFTDGLSAEALFTLTAFDTVSNFVTLSVLLTNTTEAPLTSRVSAFAFDVNPDVSGASVSGDFYDEALLNTDMNAHGVGTVDLCFRSGNGNGNNGNGGGNNCNRGAGGPDAAESGTFEITLDFASLLADSEITLSNFVVRYQSLNFGSGSGAGLGTCIDCQDERAPTATAAAGIPCQSPRRLRCSASDSSAPALPVVAPVSKSPAPRETRNGPVLLRERRAVRCQGIFSTPAIASFFPSTVSVPRQDDLAGGAARVGPCSSSV